MTGAEAAGALGAASVGLGAVLVERRARERVRRRAVPIVEPPPVSAGRWAARARLLGRLEHVPWVAAAPAGGLLGAALAGPVVGAIGVAAGCLLPRWARRRRDDRRRIQVDEQLADAVASVAAGLRAGLSLPQAIRHAAEEGEPPLADGLQLIVDREALGVPLLRSLDAWAAAQPGRDVRLVVSVLRLHRRTGGDLPRVLDGLARTLRERRAAAAEVRSLTAQARLSGAILGLLPIAFFIFLSVISRQDIEAAYRSTAGLTAIGIGLVLQLAAFAWIRRLLRVEV